MILGIGNDLVDLDRFRRVLERRPGLREKLFTEAEREYAVRRSDPTERFAVRFAAKEAVLKAMGVGIGAADWHDIEVLRDEDGRPSVSLTGRAAALAAQQGIEGWRLTLSHSAIVAQAVVVALGTELVSPMLGPIGAQALPLPDAIDGGGLVPIVTPEEMNAIDRAAPEPVEELINRAGGAVARAAIELLGGAYGRRVVVLVGKGNNGNDGRNAAARLEAQGVHVTVCEVADAPDVLPDCDLVIDAAFGTGFRGDWDAPIAPPGCLVLAVDIPSGINGLNGSCAGDVLEADATITFAALKPGNVFGDGLACSGELTVADIGRDTRAARAHLVGAAAVASWIPDPASDAHKWQRAVWVVAGSPGMGGAAALCSGAAARTGAGYVRVSTPGGAATDLPIEIVRTDLPSETWAGDVIADLARFDALVIGNGLGIADATKEQIRQVVAAATGRGVPIVVDADGLTALGTEVSRFVSETTVLTPHDGEFARLTGHAPGDDRIADARALAAESGAIVLLKGRSTVVAAPDGDVLVSIAGDQRLATAGTGDVLAGIIGALLACGVEPLRAAAGGAFLHGRAGALGWRRGLVAGDVIAHLPAVLDDLTFLRP
ncbi:unannotated protein [freshwater metagenome]|uniref:ADP-dependent NAD(P)H-hydrate dehydratase n=1 Tax=freshwater metagenome TaxID=449393 RepID=A0A6J6F027_9ZZZZ|nr:NAD(P)H-hydrate dehydratase [Actinomycetota bacterium]MTA18882.1 NAD(P)H-hydrate dehydratase [Actinomycetota bacterium]